MKIENIYTENAKNVAISENTRALIACMARMNDVYDSVYDIVSEMYGRDLDHIYPSFSDAYFALDKELKAVLMGAIESTASDSGFKEI